VEVVPVGNKDGLKAFLKSLLEHQGKDGVTGRIYAVRDRDFLTKADVAKRRAKAISSADAWPLPRYSIESYIADPNYLAQILGVAASTIVDELDAIAQTQFWTDVVTACREDLAYRSRLQRPEGQQHAATRDLAIEALNKVIKQFSSQLTEAISVHVEERVDHFASDFHNDGPIWTRVHGRTLLGALKLRLQERKLPVERLSRANLARWEAPAALVSDLEAFLDAISKKDPQPSGQALNS
jgi:hypothetical protein